MAFVGTHDEHTSMRVDVRTAISPHMLARKKKPSLVKEKAREP